MDKTITRYGAIGTISIPSSKSETIRALLISTFARGRSIIHNPLISQDTESCISICRTLGAEITVATDSSSIAVDSYNLGNGLTEATLDCGNSGTTMYLAAPMAASLGFPCTFTGDKQLLFRPVGALLGCLKNLGARIEPLNTLFPPFTVTGPLAGGHGTIICKTSQFLSSLLLGCPLAEDTTSLDIPLLYEKPYIRITMEFLDQQGIEYRRHQDLQHFDIPGRQAFMPHEWRIDGDFSSASFFFCAAAITGGQVTVQGLRQSDPQGDKGILRILSALGCIVTWNNDSVTVEGPKILHGGTFDLNSMPDTLPILAVVGCFAKEPVNLVNVPQARIKETDRISLMKTLLVQCGAKVTELPDGLMISGNGGLKLEGGRKIDGQGDHRIIMSMAIAGLRCEEPLTLVGIDSVSVSFPTFFDTLATITSESGT
jgi:3-phosphoshikimate 1-carboxyvinyltransferase